jgi:hypothetical protein
MNASQPERPDGALHPEDLLALDLVGRGSAWLRAVLCTLARRGVALRNRDPARAQAILHALEVSPLYKGGHFLFDLLEWEDFMVDGPPPPLVPTALDARALARLTHFLSGLRAQLDGALDVPGVESVENVVPADAAPGPSPDADADLPPLEAGFFLYEDVILGVVQAVGGVLARSRGDAGGPGS